MSSPGFTPGVISRLPEAALPPLVNGGVKELAGADAHGLGGPPRFDKYEATVEQAIVDVLQTFKSEWGPGVEWEDKPFRAGNYAFIRHASRWETELAIKFGGKQPFPWVGSCAGVVSPRLAQIVRRWPHRCTTVDVKFDIQGEEAFEYAVGVADKIRRRQRIVPEIIGKGDLDGIKGRTVYMGSKQSGFRLTIYEKSKQMHTVKGLIVPPNLVRIEGRFKPQSREAAKMMATLEPSEFFATTKWGREVFESLVGDAAPPMPLPRNGANEDDQAMVGMLAQYLRRVLKVKDREGGWAKFGEYLELLVPEAEGLIEARTQCLRDRNDAARQ